MVAFASQCLGLQLIQASEEALSAYGARSKVPRRRVQPTWMVGNVACTRRHSYPSLAPRFMQGLSPQQHCDGVAEQYKDLWKLLDIK